MVTTQMKTAIIISLGDLEQLMKQYVDEEMRGDEFLKEQMRFGHFLLWLKKRQEDTTVYCNVCRTVHKNSANHCPSMAGL